MKAPSRLEEQITQWRSYLRHRQAIHSVDVAELEDHLREQIDGLLAIGLSPDEAFLVGVKRMGNLDALSREFALEHSERLWKQLVAAPASNEARSLARRDTIAAFGLAVAAAVSIRIPALFGIEWGVSDVFFARNLVFFTLPFVAAYFAWKRRVSPAMARSIAIAFAAAVTIANIYPFTESSGTLRLSALHLPIGLWLLVGVAYGGERWRQVAGRMDFVRFSGELFIYCVLIALGGGVLVALMTLIFKSIGIDVRPLFVHWILPCGIAGVIPAASWLVEAKQSVIENMAPVLARLFTPLFATVLITFLAALVVTGRANAIGRDMLLGFDLLLVLVLALLIYSLSARDREAAPGAFDVLNVVLLLSALAADAVALSNILTRIGTYGFTANRVAALGVNLILLVNLAWSAVLYLRFLRRRASFARVEQWQASYLPVYAAWAAVVVAVFPPLFHYL